MERTIVGRGWEHEVMLPKNDKLKEKWVFKKPHWLTVLILRTTGGMDQLRREYQEAQALIAHADIVKLPESRIFDTIVLGFREKGYIIVQRRVYEDRSVDAVQEALKSSGQDLLANIFDVQPENFISQGGTIYWIDPSHAYHRLLNRNLGIPFAKSAKMQAFLVRTCRRIVAALPSRFRGGG